MEYREVYGLVLAQQRNDYQLTEDNLKNVVTKNKELNKDAIRDLLVATITLKYVPKILISTSEIHLKGI